jgi:NAD(P)-dependent dehydrogenase (short-subunit alcohol dehydrogenase family)
VNLDGRCAVVTGGGSGIGAACAQLLREQGATVVTWGTSRDTVDVVCDVSDEAQVATAMLRTGELAGVPSLLVAAAGIPGATALLSEQPISDWDQTMAVNLRGAFLTLREVARAMIAARLSGSMVTISSTSGLYVIPTADCYSTSKAAVNHLCRVAAIDLGTYGIRVNAVCPGPTATPMLGYLMADPAYRREVASVTPLGEIGTPQLLADTVVNVLRSDWLNGQVIAVDGGESLVTARGGWALPRSAPRSRPTT